MIPRPSPVQFSHSIDAAGKGKGQRKTIKSGQLFNIHYYCKIFCLWYMLVCCLYMLMRWLSNWIDYLRGVVNNYVVFGVLFSSIFHLTWTELLNYHIICFFCFLFQFVLFYHMILNLYVSYCFERLILRLLPSWFIFWWYPFNQYVLA